jgi:hypothetical protein
MRASWHLLGQPNTLLAQGGGNNFYGADIAPTIDAMSAAEQARRSPHLSQRFR